jgi:hypothetical protein
LTGPASTNGLKLKSYRTELNDGLESIWTGREDLCAFPGILAGGIVATLIETQVHPSSSFPTFGEHLAPFGEHLAQFREH